MSGLCNKVLILAAGLGTRMQREDETAVLDEQQAEAADGGEKVYMPFEKGPFLDYSLQKILDVKEVMGLRSLDVGLVINPKHTKFRQYYERLGERLAEEGLNLTCIHQKPQLGTAHAVLAARDWIGKDDFVLWNGDNYYLGDVVGRLMAYNGGDCACAGYDRAALIANSNIEPERIRRFAVIEVDRNGYLTKIVEKPENPDKDYPNASVSMNAFRFTSDIVQACEMTPPDPKNKDELLITKAVEIYIDEMHRPMKVIPVREGVIDLTQKGDVNSAANFLRRVSAPSWYQG